MPPADLPKTLLFLGLVLSWRSSVQEFGGLWSSPSPPENDLVSPRVTIIPQSGSGYDVDPPLDESVLVGELNYIFNDNGSGEPQITAHLLDLHTAIANETVFDFTNTSGFYASFPSIYYDENGDPQTPRNLSFTAEQRTLKSGFRPFGNGAGTTDDPSSEDNMTGAKGFKRNKGFTHKNGFTAKKGFTKENGF
jgi:hypothetical protein